ncbi:MAG: lipoyl(octanoyl) transferase LipB [Phycisphaeraceae bacterium]
MPYAHALALQREVNLAVAQGNQPPTLLLVEHDPVITITHRPNAWDNLLAPQSRLDELGIKIELTDRGGDITYHGPGQLVAYPILRMNPLGLNLSSYMRLLEQIIIDLLAGYGIEGQREPGATGVWVDVSGFGQSGAANAQITNAESRLAKVCAMGVRVRKNTTMHGLALNVTTDLSHFTTIDPCGLGGRPVTSLAELMGDAVPTMDQVKQALIDQMIRSLNARRAGADS